MPRILVPFFATLSMAVSALASDPPKVVFLTGDEEYRSEESMPMLAKILRRDFGFHVSVGFSLDEDGVIDSEDNCPAVANPNQTDTDGDGAGDDCDAMPENANHLLLRQSFIQAGGTVTGDRYRVRGVLSSGAHLSTGDVYQVRGSLRP